MSFDVHLLAFTGGRPGGADAAKVKALLAPFIRRDPLGWPNIVTVDGDAQLYGYDEDNPGIALMVNHASGAEIWELLVRVAREAGYQVIVPIGCPAAYPEGAQLHHLPDEFDLPLVRVGSGAELQALIEGY